MPTYTAYAPKWHIMEEINNKIKNVSVINSDSEYVITLIADEKTEVHIIY
jgi:hypothetical protein